MIPAPPERLRIHTRERRYLLPDAGAVLKILESRGRPIEYRPGQLESAITTLYLDTPGGSWSVGRGRTKFRAKQYGGAPAWWFELKRRSGNVVDKWRRPATLQVLAGILDGSARWPLLEPHVGREPLARLFVVRYFRTAFEWGDVRVTVDRDVRFFRAGKRRRGRAGPSSGASKGWSSR